MVSLRAVLGASVLCAGMAAVPAAAQSLFDTANALSDNQWGFLSTNSFRDGWPSPAQYYPQGSPGEILGTPRSVINAWSSFAWDSKRDQLIMFGGGHGNYSGNEVYLWDGNTGAWGRGSLPSEVTYAAVDYTAFDGSDNAPVSSHTYDNNIYLPNIDRFAVFGGGPFARGEGHFRDESGLPTGPYFWDPAKADANKVGGTTGSHIRPDQFQDVQGGEMWENRHNPIPYWRGYTSGATAYAEENGKDVAYVDNPVGLWKYTVNDINDASSDTWEAVGDSVRTLGGNYSDGPGAIDAEDQLFVRIGATAAGNRFFFYDLSKNDQGTLAPATVFDPEIIGGEFDTNLSYAGMDYDLVRDRFVVWDEEGQLWELRSPETIGTEGWELILIADVLMSDEGFPVPGSVPNTGILGKWEYIPDYDIFLGLFDPDDGGVWAYKPEDWSPLSSVPIPAAGWMFISAMLGLVSLKRRRRT